MDERLVTQNTAQQMVCPYFISLVATVHVLNGDQIQVFCSHADYEFELCSHCITARLQSVPPTSGRLRDLQQPISGFGFILLSNRVHTHPLAGIP